MGSGWVLGRGGAGVWLGRGGMVEGGFWVGSGEGGCGCMVREGWDGGGWVLGGFWEGGCGCMVREVVGRVCYSGLWGVLGKAVGWCAFQEMA